ncbi:hypothetical protein FISHEDRAFT_76756 [Fistulina hepatica ATCC 64428]|uniref:Uncharacterized protein n=1 Tax=Fistulina hepatica ATCC 64428 TaxID=1128425 RepID=A0A0D7A4E5_9AGAR|nr:hypothetical protein FISHEDRAFT_76756 [Fistulina hepatica ATCC 64428]
MRLSLLKFKIFQTHERTQSAPSEKPSPDPPKNGSRSFRHSHPPSHIGSAVQRSGTRYAAALEDRINWLEAQNKALVETIRALEVEAISLGREVGEAQSDYYAERVDVLGLQRTIKAQENRVPTLQRQQQRLEKFTEQMVEGVPLLISARAAIIDGHPAQAALAEAIDTKYQHDPAQWHQVRPPVVGARSSNDYITAARMKVRAQQDVKHAKETVKKLRQTACLHADVPSPSSSETSLAIKESLNPEREKAMLELLRKYRNGEMPPRFAAASTTPRDTLSAPSSPTEVSIEVVKPPLRECRTVASEVTRKYRGELPPLPVTDVAPLRVQKRLVSLSSQRIPDSADKSLEVPLPASPRSPRRPRQNSLPQTPQTSSTFTSSRVPSFRDFSKVPSTYLSPRVPSSPTSDQTYIPASREPLISRPARASPRGPVPQEDRSMLEANLSVLQENMTVMRQVAVSSSPARVNFAEDDKVGKTSPRLNISNIDVSSNPTLANRDVFHNNVASQESSKRAQTSPVDGDGPCHFPPPYTVSARKQHATSSADAFVQTPTSATFFHTSGSTPAVAVSPIHFSMPPAAKRSPESLTRIRQRRPTMYPQLDTPHDGMPVPVVVQPASPRATAARKRSVSHILSLPNLRKASASSPPCGFGRSPSTEFGKASL